MLKDDTSGQVLKDGSDPQNGPVHTVHDASRASDAQHIELARQLETVKFDLQKKTDALREDRAQLQHVEKLALIGKFGASVIHELNNPLTVIAAEADEIMDIACGGQNDGLLIRTSARHIKDCANRVRHIIDHVRLYARKDATDPWDELDVNQVIKNALLMVKPRLQQAGVNLRLSLREKLSPIWGNGHNLESAFQNIIANAADALVAAGNCEDHIITITTGEGIEACISVTISDNGCGMTENVRNHIFEPFFTTKDKGQGTGLGLAITKNHIEEHRGSLEVSSSAGKGTVFRIKLPLERCPQPTRTPKPGS